MEWSNSEVYRFLRAKPFASRSVSEKLTLMERGRPVPDLQITQKNRSQNFIRKFHNSMYDQLDWLCGFSETDKLYCWPCLLFAKGLPTNFTDLSAGGVSDLNNFSNTSKRHSQSQQHINSTLDYIKFDNTRIDLAYCEASKDISR